MVERRGDNPRHVRRPRVGRTVPVRRRLREEGPNLDPAAASRADGSAGTPRPTCGSRRAWRHPQARSSAEGRANRPGEPPFAGRGPESDPAAAIRADGSAGTPRPTCGSRTAWRHSQARSSPEGRANRPGEPTIAGRGPELDPPAASRPSGSAGTPRPTFVVGRLAPRPAAAFTAGVAGAHSASSGWSSTRSRFAESRLDRHRSPSRMERKVAKSLSLSRLTTV